MARRRILRPMTDAGTTDNDDVHPAIPWPSSMDTLLTIEYGEWHVASLRWSRGRWYARIRGYRVAAEELTRCVLERDREQMG